MKRGSLLLVALALLLPYRFLGFGICSVWYTLLLAILFWWAKSAKIGMEALAKLRKESLTEGLESLKKRRWHHPSFVLAFYIGAVTALLYLCMR
ncbi:MAG: hypothetical protein C6H99_02095 [Epsilonproteobacteria bacterium]|nr:hypothetical protein [Campylobacterota bacterium]NPA63874.1 hypothetical protein [Campylobacterota bacterium]